MTSIKNTLIVKFTDETSQSEINTLANSIAATEIETTEVLGYSLFEVNTNKQTVETALKTLSASSLVESVSPNSLVEITDIIPNDTNFNDLWGLHNTGQQGGKVGADIDALAGWEIAKESPNVIVAVIDTGVDYTHPDLADNIWTNSEEIADNGIDDDGNGFVDDIHGYDFYADDADPQDENGHGTHVAGTIGAVGDNELGVAGVTWDVQIMPLRFVSPTGSGTTFNAIKALDYAVLMGAQITNNSWGSNTNSQTLSDAIAAASAAGQLFIAAAGNNYGKNNDINPYYPSGYNLDNIISVAATDRNDKLADFSNFGPTTVDLAAPGDSIYSTLPGGGYGYKSGTSMATPHVAGAAALLWEKIATQNPDWSQGQIATKVKQDLLAGVDPLPDLAGKVLTNGRLNLENALGGPLPATINGKVWHDLNANGIWDQNEPTLANQKIFLDQNQDGQLNSGETSTTSNSKGNYSFKNVQPGIYTVAMMQQPSWKQTAPFIVPGYNWDDSKTTSGPSFNWVDISSVGTKVPLGDDDFIDVTLPFNFSFYGQNKTNIKISSNGYLTFGDQPIKYDNEPIPNQEVLSANDLIAPFWEDFNPLKGGGIYYYSLPAEERFIVQYQDVQPFSVSGYYTFQVILESDGTIFFQYKNLNGPTNQATIGLENANGTEGIQVAYNSNYAENNLAVQFEPNTIPIAQPHQVFVQSGNKLQNINFGSYQINQPTINIANIEPQTVVEGLNNNVQLMFEVTLSQASQSEVKADYGSLPETGEGKATEGSDYTPVSGTLTFAPGETSKTIAVTILNDNVLEQLETLTVQIVDPTDGTKKYATGIITDTLEVDATMALPGKVENLTLTGQNQINGTGNSGANIITGNDNNNKLFGRNGNDILVGNAGNDSLNGQLDADTMNGGLGDDLYTVDNLQDLVIELPSEGTDQVNASITYVLPENVERLLLQGIDNINGTGNLLNNTLIGNDRNNQLTGLAGDDVLNGKAGHDILRGGEGNDVLTGGDGSDRFTFDQPEGIDRIKDFNPGMDSIRLKASGFGGGLTKGTLAANQFVTTGTQLTADTRFIYNTTTGALFFDPDGNGILANNKFATLSTHPDNFSHSDIIIF